jgi:hypothetical protein
MEGFEYGTQELRKGKTEEYPENLLPGGGGSHAVGSPIP